MILSKQSSKRAVGLGKSALFVSQCLLATAVSANVLESKITSFEEQLGTAKAPAYVEVQPGSSVELSTKQAIHGDKSLQWKWSEPSSAINIVNTPAVKLVTDQEAKKAFGRSATQVLSFWVYNEEKRDKSETFQVMLNNDPNYKIEMSMDFIGWRSVGVSLVNDLKFKTGFIESITFKAPEESNGTLLIDRVMLSIDDNRYQWSDHHVTTRYPFEEIDFGLSEEIPQGSADEYQGLEKISTLVLDYLASDAVQPPAARGEEEETLQSRYEQFGIQVSGDNITGPHVLMDPQQVIYQPKHLKPEDKAIYDNYVVMGEKDTKGAGESKRTGYAFLMLDIAKAYHLSDSDVERKGLQDMYLNMTRHLLNQGFFEGSGLVTTHHWGYSGRWWYLSSLLMGSVLEDEYLLADVYNALVWYSREFKDSFDMVVGPESSNLDYFNTLSIQHLALVLLEPDTDRRIALLKKYSEFIGESLAQTPPGVFDGFRPDGTAWRHKGNYPGYSFGAMDSVAKVIQFLSGTPFAVSPEGRASLKKAMVAGWVYSNPVIGIANSGRHPFDLLGPDRYSDGMRYLALSGNPATGDSVDEELASIYLQVTGSSEQEGKKIFNRNIKPAELPEGHWSFNGGAFGIHRYQNIMVTLKAYNSTVWSSEIYAADNRYGRYQSHGSVQIMPYGDPVSMGYQQEGWDWNRNPGTTSIHLDWEMLDSPIPASLMLRSEERFSGSATLDDQFGLFAFKHKAPDDKERFDPTFVARKSVLAIGNRLIMLGSDISNSQSGANATETTLFQHAITTASNNTVVNGTEVTDAAYSAQFGQNDWLIDGMGNGYLIASESEVKVARQQQESRHNKTRVVTNGHFASAWINHGANPDKAEYEYQVILNTTPEEMQILAENQKQDKPGYDVLRKDNQFHIIKDEGSKVTGIVAFEGGDTNHSLVTHVDKPALVMVRELSSGRLSLTVVSPDLNIQGDEPHQPIDVTVTLDGAWEMAEGVSRKIGLTNLSHTTEASFTSDFGQSTPVVLKRMGEETVEPPVSDDGDEGGAMGWMSLLALLSALFMRGKR